MSKWNIIYNGFGSNVVSRLAGDEPPSQFRWDHVHVTSMQSTPVMADDGVSTETIKHTINGTAMISETTEANFRTALHNARQRLTRGPAAGYGLEIYIDDNTSGTEVAGHTGEGIESLAESSGVASLNGPSRTVVYSGSNHDDYGLPICEFNINEVMGTHTAIVGFTISWHRYEPFTSANSNFDVLSHTWTQEHEIAEDGLTKITVTGQLRVKNYVGDSNFDGEAGAGTPERGSDPDRYRNLVMPAVPSNFRVVNMKWATDPTGTKLNYTIILQEFARPLPFPAKKGSGSFSYRRALDSGPSGFMGIKTFQAELEGDAASSPADLLASLLRCAASRIYFGGSEASPRIDLIQSVEVTEHDIFNKRRIGLKIVAMGLQTTSPSGDAGGIHPGPGFNLLGSFFTGDLSLATKPNVYGSQLIKSVKEQLYLPYRPDSQGTGYTNTTFPRAMMVSASEFSADLNNEYQVNEIEDTTVGDVIATGEEAHSNVEGAGHAKQPYMMARGTERLKINNNFTVVSGCSLYANDLVYQHGKPEVLLISEYEMVRLNKPPSRFIMKPPSNGLIMEEDFHIERGTIDANNNREYRGVFRRVVRILDNGSGGGWGVDTSISLPGYGSIFTRSWWQSALSHPIDARIEGSSQASGYGERTLFDFGGESGEKTELGTQPNHMGS